MTDTLIELLEEEKIPLVSAEAPTTEAWNDAIQKAIDIVREHQTSEIQELENELLCEEIDGKKLETCSSFNDGLRTAIAIVKGHSRCKMRGNAEGFSRVVIEYDGATPEIKKLEGNVSCHLNRREPKREIGKEE